MDGRWTDAGRLGDARGDHTATMLDDGTVLVAGGGNFATGEVLDTAERFYPALPDLGGCALPLARGAAIAGGAVLAYRIAARRHRAG